jgi:hypothetical protein
VQGPYFWECPDLFVVPLEDALSSSSSGGSDISDRSNGSAAVWCSKYSLNGGVGGDWYYTGSYDPAVGVFSAFLERTGHAQAPRAFDESPFFYASKSFLDPISDRRVLWGWLKMRPWPADPVAAAAQTKKPQSHQDASPGGKAQQERRFQRPKAAAGTAADVAADDFETIDDDGGGDGGWGRPWQNALGVPRTVEVVEDAAEGGGSSRGVVGQESARGLRTWPLPELGRALRSDAPVVRLGGTTVAVAATAGRNGTAAEPPLGVAAGAHLDLDIAVRLVLRGNGSAPPPPLGGDGAVQCGVRVLLDTAHGDEYLDVLLPPLPEMPANANESAAARLRTMRVLVDGSVVEAFFDGGRSPSRVLFHYPQRPTAVGVAALAVWQPRPPRLPRRPAPAAGTPQPPTPHLLQTAAQCVFETLDVYTMRPMGFDASRCCST